MSSKELACFIVQKIIERIDVHEQKYGHAAVDSDLIKELEEIVNVIIGQDRRYLV